MRLIAWLVGLPLTIIVVLFAVSNRQPITVGFWPLEDGIEAPAFLIGLVPLAIGLLLGAGLAGIGTVHARYRHRSATRTIRSMEQRMADLIARTPKLGTSDSKTGASSSAGPDRTAPFS